MSVKFAHKSLSKLISNVLPFADIRDSINLTLVYLKTIQLLLLITMGRSKYERSVKLLKQSDFPQNIACTTWTSTVSYAVPDVKLEDYRFQSDSFC